MVQRLEPEVQDPPTHPAARFPPRAGVKWIHARPFGGRYPDKPLATSGASLAAAEQMLADRERWQVDKPACQDHNAACKDWAAHGEVRGLGAVHW